MDVDNHWLLHSKTTVASKHEERVPESADNFIPTFHLSFKPPSKMHPQGRLENWPGSDKDSCVRGHPKHSGSNKKHNHARSSNSRWSFLLAASRGWWIANGSAVAAQRRGLGPVDGSGRAATDLVTETDLSDALCFTLCFVRRRRLSDCSSTAVVGKKAEIVIRPSRFS